MADRRPSPSIRPLGPDDEQAWRPLWRGYLEFYGAEIEPEVSALAFSRLLDAGEPMEGALAHLDGRAVGLVHLVRHRSTWTRGDYLYLQDLFTEDAARGRGVGRALIQHAYARAAELGCSRVYWLTHEANARAMSLYDAVAERSGFIQYRKSV